MAFVSGGCDNEIVSAVTTAIGAWRIPTVFSVGVSSIAKKQKDNDNVSKDQNSLANEIFDVDLGTLNFTTDRHVFLLEEPMQIDENFGLTTASSGISPIWYFFSSASTVYQ